MLTSSATHNRIHIDLYGNRPQKITKKTISKAFHKAHNSNQSIRTHQSRFSAMGVALNTMAVLAVSASVLTPAGALENGVRNSFGPAQSTFCKLGFSSPFPYKTKGHCTGLKINNRQIVTAKHCGTRPGTHVWAKTSHTGWEWATHRLDHPEPDVDLTIFTFPENLAGYTYCLPLMTKETRDLLEASPKNICGLAGRAIVEGRGKGSSKKSTLFSYPFDFTSQKINEKYKITLLKGTQHNNQPVCIRQGDSGGPVVGCNPKTGHYELMGINAKSTWTLGNTKVCGEAFSGFVDTAYHPELREWLINNTQPCISTDGYALQPNDFFKSDAHSWDKCRIPMKFDGKQGISINERCDCFHKDFISPPSSLNCPSKNKEIAACVEIDTIENTSSNEKKPNKIVIKNSCNGCVDIGFFYQPLTINGQFGVRAEQVRLERGTSTELTDSAEYILDKSKGISFKRCGKDEITIPKFFDTTLQTTKPRITTTTALNTAPITESNATLPAALNTTPTTESNATLATALNTAPTTKLNTTLTTALDAIAQKESETIRAPEDAPAARKDSSTTDNATDNSYLKFAAGAGAFAAVGLAASVAVVCNKKKQTKDQFNLVPTHPPI